MKEEERSEVVTRHACTCTVQKYLVVLGIFSLLMGTGIGAWFLVKPLLSPIRLQQSVSFQDSVALQTRCKNVTVEEEQDPKIPFGNANGKKVFFRTNRSNFLLEVEVEGRSNRLLLCHENWDSSLGSTICKQMGHIQLTHHKGVNLTDVKVDPNQEFLQVSPNWQENAKERWHIRRKCSSGRIVALKCSECGTTYSKMPEISEGKDVSLSHWPWQVGLYLNGKRICAGALLSREWIVSAAHCMDSPFQLSSWVALVGLDAHASIKEDTGAAMEKMVLHPSYSHGSHDYDIAMLKLKEPLSFSDTIQAVCLPQYHQDIPNSSSCWISGQDYPRPENATFFVAKTWAAVPVVLNKPKNCNGSCRHVGKITPRMLCAHYLDGSINACKSENGGALVCQNRDTQHLMGIRSWDTGCKEPDQPGVYTNVVELLDWIHDVMEANEL
ncbi:transmembrane protease serine 5 [Sceloporus undulatus]|uniref:transmembrane protease serine 5 n=1 Tax=Sceloporus undulatus TaxID=8520 RepID=UPI001C4DCC7F|nr:transmembrane protease serine 5 [Sceloporus undulatus]